MIDQQSLLERIAILESKVNEFQSKIVQLEDSVQDNSIKIAQLEIQMQILESIPSKSRLGLTCTFQY